MLLKKYIFFICLIMALALVFAGCGDDNNSSTDITVSNTSEAESDSSSQEATSSKEDSSESDTPSKSETVSKPTASNSQSSEPHKHTYKMTTVAATCDKDGYKFGKCNCGATTQTEIIKKTGHKFGVWESDEEPSIVSGGTKFRICSVCKIEEFEDVPMLTADYGKITSKIIELTNSERKKSSLSELKANSELQKAADIRAKDVMEKNDSKDISTFLSDNGVAVTAVYDNALVSKWGADDEMMMAEKAVEEWLKDSDFTAKILSDEFTDISVGVSQKAGEFYLVMILIK